MIMQLNLLALKWSKENNSNPSGESSLGFFLMVVAAIDAAENRVYYEDSRYNWKRGDFRWTVGLLKSLLKIKY